MKFFAIPVLASALMLSACGSSGDETTTETPDIAAPEGVGSTVVDVVSGNPEFSTLVGALTSAELAETLTGDGPFTIFAPTNDAFVKIPAEELSALMSEARNDDLHMLLLYHVVADKMDSATLISAIKEGGGGHKFATVNGAELTATLDGDAIILTDAAGNKSTITATDVEGSNGLVHVVDGVLTPE